MKFTLDNPAADYVFGHYGDGKLKVNQTDYNNSSNASPTSPCSAPVYNSDFRLLISGARWRNPA